MADHAICYALGIQDKYLEKITFIRSTLPPGPYKISLDTSPPTKILLLHCSQINKIKNELDGPPSSLLTSLHVLNYNVSFSLTHLVFLELGDTHQHLNFKILDEKNSKVVRITFYLQLDTHQHLNFKILDEKNSKVVPITFYLQLLKKQ